MPTIQNKTHRPLSIPLPGGKTLFLGPGQFGDVAAKAANGPGFKKLLEAGEIEITEDSQRTSGGAGRGNQARHGMVGHSSGGSIRRSGDR